MDPRNLSWIQGFNSKASVFDFFSFKKQHIYLFLASMILIIIRDFLVYFEIVRTLYQQLKQYVHH